MFQVRIHGRGGQGVVTAAELLSVAAFLEGKHAQAFPSFGSERTGSPVVSFCRIDDKEIRLREPILEPDGLIVQDPTLFKAIDVFQGLRPDGYLLVNTNKGFDELHLADVVAKLPKGHALVSALYDSVTEDGKLRLVFDMMGRMVPIDVDKRDVFSIAKKRKRGRRRRPDRRHRKVGATNG
jgi:pyruvate ferredoxin oxidoreductase gamma subunit